jgi:DNA-binding NarL/FixJ family response regulator
MVQPRKAEEMMIASKTARILLVDDHEVVREGLKVLISNARPEWEIAGEARDGVEGVEQTQHLKPDIVVLDITMPKMSGLETSRKLRTLGVNCPILIFTTHDSARLGDDAREVGAQGFVVKSQAFRDLVRAIDVLLHGGTFFGDAVPKKVEPEDSPSGLIYCLGLLFAPPGPHESTESRLRLMRNIGSHFITTKSPHLTAASMAFSASPALVFAT